MEFMSVLLRSMPYLLAAHVERSGVNLAKRRRPWTLLGTNGARACYAADSSATSIFTPGPIALESATLRTYLPLEPDGFALTIASRKASKFFMRKSKERLVRKECVSTGSYRWAPYH